MCFFSISDFMHVSFDNLKGEQSREQVGVVLLSLENMISTQYEQRNILAFACKWVLLTSFSIDWVFFLKIGLGYLYLRNKETQQTLDSLYANKMMQVLVQMI